MRPPRVRLTVRRMMLLIAAIALGIALWEEFGEGLPPRSVVRGIPGRVARLRPGMTWDQAREILGLERSWLTGGTGARFATGEGFGRNMHEIYYVRQPRTVLWEGRGAGGQLASYPVLQSTAVLHLWFRTDSPAGGDWRKEDSTRLVRATFARDSRTIAAMPSPVD